MTVAALSIDCADPAALVVDAQTVGGIARPGPLRRLGGAARVTVVSAPTGSGKTFLLRSWLAQEGVAGRAVWVPLGREHRDPQLFWVRVLDALRGTGPPMLIGNVLLSSGIDAVSAGGVQ